MRPGPGRSVVFDRVAHEYDATRGGDERGRDCAQTLLPLLPADGTLLEVGVGTGVVAGALHAFGHNVSGVDLSPQMLSRAIGRIGPRVAVGDAARLPVRDEAVAAAYSVWVLHLVADRGAVLGEVHRVVRPGGRYLVLTAAVDPPPEHDEIGGVMWPLATALRGGSPKPDHPDLLRPLAEAAGWALTSAELAAPRTWEQTPAEAVAVIESRTLSLLWDLDDDTWRDHVQPALETLRGLPEQDRPRTRSTADRVVVLDRR